MGGGRKEGGQAGGGQQGLAHRVPLEIGTGTIPATITRRSGVGAALEKIYARHLVAGGLLVSQDAAHSYALLHRRRLCDIPHRNRSEENTSELQSLMRISDAVFCWEKKKTTNT